MKEYQHLSSLSLAILCLILKSPQSGYDLKKSFELTPMGHFSSSPGAIYPALKRMEKEGVIVGKVENSTSLRPSKLLSVTPMGIEFLKQYFQRPVEKNDIIFNMDQLMLRFAFMTPLVGRPVTCEFLKQFIEVLARHVDELKGVALSLNNDPLEGRLALAQGIESFEANLNWAKRALIQISDHINKIT